MKRVTSVRKKSGIVHKRLLSAAMLDDAILTVFAYQLCIVPSSLRLMGRYARR